MLKIAIISGSLNSKSKSRILAEAAKTHLMNKGMDVDFKDSSTFGTGDGYCC